MSHTHNGNCGCTDDDSIVRTLVPCNPDGCAVSEVSADDPDVEVALEPSDVKVTVSGGGQVALADPSVVGTASAVLVIAFDADVQVSNVGVNGATTVTVAAGTAKLFVLATSPKSEDCVPVRIWVPQS